MEIQFKNKHIFFALDGIWQNLDYRFKYHINQLVTANQEDDFMQTVIIDDTTLVQIYSSVSSQREGIAKTINQEMLDALQPQLLALSNIIAVEAGTEQPNEASLALLGIKGIKQANTANQTEKILNGKTQILS